MKKKIILPGITFLTSFYFSTILSVGFIIGYLGTVIFWKKLIETKRVKSVTPRIGKWTIHLHHWIQGVIALLIILLLNFSVSGFYVGAILGIILQDLCYDRRWYKVVYRK